MGVFSCCYFSGLNCSVFTVLSFWIRIHGSPYFCQSVTGSRELKWNPDLLPIEMKSRSLHHTSHIFLKLNGNLVLTILGHWCVYKPRLFCEIRGDYKVIKKIWCNTVIRRNTETIKLNVPLAHYQINVSLKIINGWSWIKRTCEN